VTDEADTPAAVPVESVRAPLGSTEVTVGQAVGLTFRSSWRCLLPFAVAGLAAWAAGEVLGWMLGNPDAFGLRGLNGTDPGLVAWRKSVGGRAQGVLALVSLAIETGAVAAGMGLQLSSRAVTAAGMLSPLLRRLPSLVAIGLLGALALDVPGWVTQPSDPALTGLLGLLPFLLAPLYLSWSLAVPLVVQEGPGFVAALRRSAALTFGHRWKLLGLFIAAAVPLVAASALLTAVDPGTLWYSPAYAMAAAFSFLSLTVAPAAAFHLLRTAKEGPATCGLAEVFE